MATPPRSTVGSAQVSGAEVQKIIREEQKTIREEQKIIQEEQKIIREEIDRKDKYFEFIQKQMIDKKDEYFEFVQKQMEEDRRYFRYLFNWAAIAVSVIVLLGLAFTFGSVWGLQREMKKSYDAEVSKVDAKISETLNSDVQKKVEEEFSKSNITELVATTAKEYTEKGINETFRDEISKQVEKGISEREPIIQKAVEDQAKEAVKTLEPTIQTAVNTATQEQVKSSVDPIQAQLSGYGDMIRIGNLVVLARGDDREAFDYLVQITEGNKPESSNEEFRKLAGSTVSAIVIEKTFDLTVHAFEEKKSLEELKKLVRSKDVIERITAIDSLSFEDKSVMPVLISVIKTDPSVSVLSGAVNKLNQFTKQSFEFWKTKDILDWWEKDKAAYQ